MKYNYLIFIEGGLKIVVSENEIPEHKNFHWETDRAFQFRLNLWLNQANKFNIADKENENLFKQLANKSEPLTFGNERIFEAALSQGIILPAKNVEIRELESEQIDIYLGNRAFFIPTTITDETQDEMWIEANRLYSLKEYTRDGRALQSEHFTITRKNK